MIERETVFVLGAGASKPYGFPVGRDLLKSVVKDLQEAESPMYKVINSIIKEKDIAEFCHNLHRSRLPSIDAFLERRPEFLHIGKLSIAYAIIHHENDNSINNCMEDWYEYILEKMNAPIEYFDENKISFLTKLHDCPILTLKGKGLF